VSTSRRSASASVINSPAYLQQATNHSGVTMAANNVDMATNSLPSTCDIETCCYNNRSLTTRQTITDAQTTTTKSLLLYTPQQKLPMIFNGPNNPQNLRFLWESRPHPTFTSTGSKRSILARTELVIIIIN